MFRTIAVSVAILIAAVNIHAVSVQRCQTPVGTLASNLNLTWITAVPKWYITTASREYWYQTASVCLNRPFVGAGRSLLDMCLETKFDFNSTTTCYRKSVTQKCEINKNNGNPFVRCDVAHHDPGTNPKILENFTKRVLVTDNKTYALFVRCADGLSSWYLGTTRKPTPSQPRGLTDSNYRKVLNMLSSVGFPLNKVTKVDICPPC